MQDLFCHTLKWLLQKFQTFFFSSHSNSILSFAMYPGNDPLPVSICFPHWYVQSHYKLLSFSRHMQRTTESPENLLRFYNILTYSTKALYWVSENLLICKQPPHKFCKIWDLQACQHLSLTSLCQLFCWAVPWETSVSAVLCARHSHKWPTAPPEWAVLSVWTDRLVKCPVYTYRKEKKYLSGL